MTGADTLETAKRAAEESAVLVAFVRARVRDMQRKARRRSTEPQEAAYLHHRARLIRYQLGLFGYTQGFDPPGGEHGPMPMVAWTGRQWLESVAAEWCEHPDHPDTLIRLHFCGKD